jgi:hypothetical protein
MKLECVGAILVFATVASHGSAAETITAYSTVVLATITGIYAWETKRLLEAWLPLLLAAAESSPRPFDVLVLEDASRAEHARGTDDPAVSTTVPSASCLRGWSRWEFPVLWRNPNLVWR